MPTLETPNSRTGTTLPPTTSQGDATTHKKTNGAQTYDVEDIESEPEPDKEAPEGTAKTESPMVAYLEQMFCKRLDTMQSIVERLPGVAPPIRTIEKAEGMAVFTWPDIFHHSVSRSELICVLRQMGQHVKWPQKMKAPNSFWNPGLWCDFHRDHGHKTEECVALKIEVK